MAKARPNVQFTGRWCIVSISAWDQAFMGEVEERAFL